MEEYDFLIIGAGSAGLPAAVYAARFRLKTIVIGELTGGTITTTHIVENWPGFISISGLGLADELKKHVDANQVPVIADRVVDIEKKGPLDFRVKTLEGKEFKARTPLFSRVRFKSLYYPSRGQNKARADKCGACKRE